MRNILGIAMLILLSCLACLGQQEDKKKEQQQNKKTRQALGLEPADSATIKVGKNVTSKPPQKKGPLKVPKTKQAPLKTSPILIDSSKRAKPDTLRRDS